MESIKAQNVRTEASGSFLSPLFYPLLVAAFGLIANGLTHHDPMNLAMVAIPTLVVVIWAITRSVESTRGYARGSTNDLWVLDTSTGKWSEITPDPAHPIPDARLCGELEVVDGKLWMLGGWNGGMSGNFGRVLKLLRGVPSEVIYDDIWTFDIQSQKWDKITLTDGSAKMGAISRFTTALVGSEIYIFNHRCGDSSGSNVPHIMVLDTKTKLLRKEPTKGPSPPGRRSNSSLVHLNKKLYVIGGCPQKGQFFDDHFVLDLKTFTWSKLEPTGPSPGYVGTMTAVALGEVIYLWGGARKTAGKENGHSLDYHPQLWCLNTQKNTWSYPELKEPCPGLPSPEGDEKWTKGDVAPGRTGQSMVVVRDKGYIYGGWLPFRAMHANTIVLEAPSDSALPCSMKETETSTMAPRSGHASAGDPSGKMYVFGGYCENADNKWAWDYYGEQSNTARLSLGVETFGYRHPTLASFTAFAILGGLFTSPRPDSVTDTVSQTTPLSSQDSSLVAPLGS